MKSRIIFLMLFSVLFFWSCQDEGTLTESSQKNTIEKEGKLRANQAVIFVHWGEDQGDPVEGARVFDMETNEYVSHTDGEGNAYIQTEPRRYRVVDPNYGTLQAIVTYPDDFEFDPETGKEREVIGWTMDGKPIYSDN